MVPHDFSLTSRRDHPIEPSLERQCRKMPHVSVEPVLYTHLVFEDFRRHVRQHGYPEDLWTLPVFFQTELDHRFPTTLHRVESVRSVNREHMHTEPRSYKGGFADGRRDVVEFQVEKDFLVSLLNILYDAGAAGGEEFEANLIHMNVIAKGIDDVERMFSLWHVEGENQYIG